MILICVECVEKLCLCIYIYIYIYILFLNYTSCLQINK